MVLCFWFGKYVTRRNPFLGNVFILYPLKAPENIWFFGSLRGYKIENWLALGRYVLFIQKKVIFPCGGHSIITLSQNDQNLDPLSFLGCTCSIWYHLSSYINLPPTPYKIVNCVIFYWFYNHLFKSETFNCHKKNVPLI